MASFDDINDDDDDIDDDINDYDDIEDNDINDNDDIDDDINHDIDDDDYDDDIDDDIDDDDNDDNINDNIYDNADINDKAKTTMTTIYIYTNTRMLDYRRNDGALIHLRDAGQSPSVPR